MEEIVTIVLILLPLLTMFCLYKLLDKRGLYFSLVMMNIIAFVLSFKISYVFKMNINLSIIPIISSFTIIYLFLSKYNDKETKNLIKISLYSNITVALLIAVMNFFIPAITGTISISMQETFEYNYKILIAYPIIMLLSQLATIKLYGLLKQLQDNTPVSIALTYVITGLIYTVVYYIVSYIKVLPVQYSLFLAISTYILGIAITLINVLFIYIVNKKKVFK